MRTIFTSEEHRRLRKLLETMQVKFKRKEPLFRESAELREMMAMAKSSDPVPTWPSDLAQDMEFLQYAAQNGVSFKDLDRHQLMEAWMVLRLRRNGLHSNWFRLSEGLAYKLAATELRGAVCGDLKLPMDAFYLELPANMVHAYDNKTGWHEMRALLVCKGHVTAAASQAILRRAGTNLGQGLEGVDYAEGPRMLLTCLGQPNSHSVNALDDTWFYQSHRLFEEHVPIEEALEHMRPEATIHDNFARVRIGENELSGFGSRVFFLKFVLNFCVYLNSTKIAPAHIHKEEIEAILEDKKRKNLRKEVLRKLARLENDRVFLVGTDVTIDNEVKECVRLGEDAYYKLTYRTMVRGHYRNQACGPKLSLRSVKWIEPHIRGKDLPTPVVGHNYTVK